LSTIHINLSYWSIIIVYTIVLFLIPAVDIDIDIDTAVASAVASAIAVPGFVFYKVTKKRGPIITERLSRTDE